MKKSLDLSFEGEKVDEIFTNYPDKQPKLRQNYQNHQEIPLF